MESDYIYFIMDFVRDLGLTISRRVAELLLKKSNSVSHLRGKGGILYLISDHLGLSSFSIYTVTT